jgi:hypothetical protein
MLHRYSKENFPKILKLVEELANIGKEYDATAGQVALAWLLAQGDDVIPIPGTKKIKVGLHFFWHSYFDPIFDKSHIMHHRRWMGIPR